jgi:hypothetical protein
MNFNQAYPAILIAVALLTGCSTVQNEPVSQFRAKHSIDAKKFAYINPISLDTYEAMFGFNAGLSYIGPNLKAKFGNIAGINEYADKIIKSEQDLRNQRVQMFKKLENSSANGGVICQYKLNNGVIDEIGFLVLKSGEIVEQEPLITEYLIEKTSPEKSHNE